MLNTLLRVARALLLCALIAGCTALPPETPTPVATSKLIVTLLYPGPKTAIEMGQSLKFIARVTDAQDRPVTDAQLTIAVQDDDKVVGTVQAVSDSAGTYRGGPWPVPHRIAEGVRQVSLVARGGDAVGESSSNFPIKYSTSDALLHKYGFWLDAPTLKGIAPMVVGEQGDAQNGRILWGGQIPSQHIFTDNFVEVHWREGRYNLDNADAVRRFMLEKAGNLGFTRIRSLGPFEPFQFKNWNGWKVSARPQVQPTQVEFVVFYAPETDKTYIIGTSVTLPPAGIDAHATLRDSFELHPELRASGTAPEPLPDLLPSPEPASPPLGARFYGTEQPIVLQWRPAKDLAADEYYKVSVDYDYSETNNLENFETRETSLALPEALLQKPNCGVFNWDVTIMRRGTPGGDRPTDQAISYPSLYQYVEWRYPPGVQPPFTYRCPNALF